MKRKFLTIFACVVMFAVGYAENKVSGRVYPEREDDVAWENELVAFRIYGPGTRKKGEKSFGYDIFFKYPDKGMVLEKLYGSQTSSANWAKYDSIARIDKRLAKDFENSFTYHIDHGLGMDCYAVGPTLGDGVAALLENEEISFPWCYEKAEILENGPDRFCVALDFAPRIVGKDTITEHRIISLDSNSYLNNCTVWYDGMTSDRDVVVGFPLRGGSPVICDPDKGILTYADPTQGADNGKALLGVVVDKPGEILQKNGHILLKYKLAPTDKFTYRWGFAWDRTSFPTLSEWYDYLSGI